MITVALIKEETLDSWNNPISQLTGELDPNKSQSWKDKMLEMAAGFSRPVSEEVREALQSVDRKGRDVVVGLSNTCCKWGCSKSEISSLC